MKFLKEFFDNKMHEFVKENEELLRMDGLSLSPINRFLFDRAKEYVRVDMSDWAKKIVVHPIIGDQHYHFFEGGEEHLLLGKLPSLGYVSASLGKQWTVFKFDKPLEFHKTDGTIIGDIDDETTDYLMINTVTGEAKLAMVKLGGGYMEQTADGPIPIPISVLPEKSSNKYYHESKFNELQKELADRETLLEKREKEFIAKVKELEAEAQEKLEKKEKKIREKARRDAEKWLREWKETNLDQDKFKRYLEKEVKKGETKPTLTNAFSWDLKKLIQEGTLKPRPIVRALTRDERIEEALNKYQIDSDWKGNTRYNEVMDYIFDDEWPRTAPYNVAKDLLRDALQAKIGMGSYSRNDHVRLFKAGFLLAVKYGMFGTTNKAGALRNMAINYLGSVRSMDSEYNAAQAVLKVIED